MSPKSEFKSSFAQEYDHLNTTLCDTNSKFIMYAGNSSNFTVRIYFFIYKRKSSYCVTNSLNVTWVAGVVSVSILAIIRKL